MKWFDNTALSLVIAGAVNWLLVGIFQFDLVAFLFGELSFLSSGRLCNHWFLRFIPHQPIWKNQ